MVNKAGAVHALTANEVRAELRAIDSELATINLRKTELEARRKVLVAGAREALLGFQEILAEVEVPAVEISKGIHIDNLNLPIRVANVLYGNGVRTVEKLLSLTRRDLMVMDRMGRKGISEIIYALRNKGHETTAFEAPE